MQTPNMTEEEMVQALIQGGSPIEVTDKEVPELVDTWYGDPSKEIDDDEASDNGTRPC